MLPSFVPERRFFSCIGSKVVFLIELFVFSHVSQSGWTVFGFVFASIAVFNVIDFVFVVFLVDVIVSCATVIGAFCFFVGVFRVVSACFVVSFQQATLISVPSRFSTVVASQVASVGSRVCGYLAPVFTCSSSRAPKPFSYNSLSRCVLICSYGPLSIWADLLIFPGLVAIWHMWRIRWWHVRLFRMCLWPVLKFIKKIN